MSENHDEKRMTEMPGGSALIGRGAAKKREAVVRMSFMTAFITAFMGSALNLSVPHIEAEFGVSAATVGWVVTAFTLTVAAFCAPMGKIADSTGRKRILITGILIFTCVSFTCMFAVNIKMLLALRVVEGIGGSMIFSTNFATMTASFPPNERGKALGIGLAGVYTGLSAGPVIGGIMNSTTGWRSIFIIAVCGGIASLIAALRGVPKDEKRESKLRPDIPGNILLTVSVAAVLYGLANLSVNRYAWLILVAGVALFVAFVFVELKAEDPVIRISMFTRDAVFTLSNLASLLNYGATFAISYLMSIYLQVVMGYSSQITGLILIFLPATQAVFSPFMGRLSDRVAAYKLASAGMALCVLGLFMFAFVSVTTPLVYVIAVLIMVGFGFALFASPNTNVILSRVDKSEYSIATSMNSTMRTIGQSFSMAIVTIIVGATLGSGTLNDAAPADLVRTERICFLVFTAICALGIFMSLKRGSTSEDKHRHK